MLKYQDILNGVRYLKSGDYMDCVPDYAFGRENSFSHENFSRQVRDWLNSIIIRYASIDDLSVAATADELNMLQVVGDDFNKINDHGSKLIAILCATLRKLQEGENLLAELRPRIENYFLTQFPRVQSRQEVSALADADELRQELAALKSGEAFKRRDEQLQKTAAELNAKAEQQNQQADALLAREQALQQRAAEIGLKEQQLTERSALLDTRTNTLQQSETEFQARQEKLTEQDASLRKREAGYKFFVDTIQKQKQALVEHQEKLHELYNIIIEKMGDEAESQVSYNALRQLLNFYDTEMKNTIKYAKEAEEANKALIHTVLYSSKADQKKAQTVRDYFRSTGELPPHFEDVTKAQKDWAQYLKDNKDDSVNRQKAINKINNKITLANLSRKRLTQCQAQLAATAESTLSSLEAKNTTLLSIKSYIEKLPEPDNIESDIEVILQQSQQSRHATSLHIEPSTSVSRFASDTSLSDGSERSDLSSVGSNDSADVPDAPPIAPALADSLPPPPPPGPPPPSGFFTAAAQPLKIKKSSTGANNNAAATPTMEDVLKSLGSVKLRSAPASGIQAPPLENSDLAQQLKNNAQQLDIRASKPSDEDIQALIATGKSLIYQDESKDWIMLSNKTAEPMNLSKLIELKSVIHILNSKKIIELTDSDERSTISSAITSYLRMQAIKSHQPDRRGSVSSVKLHTFANVKRSEKTSAAPKQNLELFDVLATRLHPENYSKFTYILSKIKPDNEKLVWQLQLLVPKNLLPDVRRKDDKAGHIFSIAIDDVAGLATVLQKLPNKELHGITSADLWDTKSIIKQYHKDLIATNKLALQLTPKENNKGTTKGFDLLEVLGKAKKMQNIVTGTSSDSESEETEEKQNSSAPRMGKSDSWETK